jgi:hypothetical protein
MYTYHTSHRIHSKYRRHIEWIPSTQKVDVIMLLRLPIIIIQKINPTFQRHVLSPASEKNMIIETPLVTLTHSFTSLSLSHTNQYQTSKNNNSLWRTLGSQELDDTEMGLY